MGALGFFVFGVFLILGVFLISHLSPEEEYNHYGDPTTGEIYGLGTLILGFIVIVLGLAFTFTNPGIMSKAGWAVILILGLIVLYDWIRQFSLDPEYFSESLEGKIEFFWAVLFSGGALVMEGLLAQRDVPEVNLEQKIIVIVVTILVCLIVYFRFNLTLKGLVVDWATNLILLIGMVLLTPNRGEAELIFNLSMIGIAGAIVISHALQIPSNEFASKKRSLAA